jgi:hypothetical protein
MATSPNYGWPEPDDTSLVKNGALAMRTLGNAIDSTMATMTPKSIVDAKGDLIAATANDTPARLAVGTNGQVLTADSTAATGLAWATASSGSTIVAGKNKCINGDFGVWQRGTSVNTTTYGYTADRWLGYQYGSVTVSRQATADTTNLAFIQYCGRVQRPSGQTGLNPIYLSQSLESSASIPLAGKSVTLSFYARRGSNYSSASNVLTAQIISGTGTDQNVNVGGFTGSVQVAAPTVTLTTTWQRFTTTGTVGATATQLGVVFTYTPVGTAGTNDYFEITGVQLEAASTASDFASASGGSPQAELAMCQRYYYRATATASGLPLSNTGGCVTTTIAQVYLLFPVTMRGNPSQIEFSGLNWYNFGNNTEYNTGTFTLSAATPNLASVRYTHGSAIFTAGQVGAFTSAASSSYVGFTADI